MKKFWLIIVALLVLIGGYLYSSPYLMLNSLKTAFEEKDRFALRQLVDFPLIKESVKDQLNAEYQKEVNSELTVVGTLGSIEENITVDNFVDIYTSPTGVFKAYSELIDRYALPPKVNKVGEPEEPKSFFEQFTIQHKGLDLVFIANPANSVNLIAKRSFLSWKIVDLDFIEAFKEYQTKKSTPINHTILFKEFFDRTCEAYRGKYEYLSDWLRDNMEPNEVSNPAEINYPYYKVIGNHRYTIVLGDENDDGCSAMLSVHDRSALNLYVEVSPKELQDLLINDGYKYLKRFDNDVTMGTQFQKGDAFVDIELTQFGENVFVIGLSSEFELKDLENKY